MKKRRKCNGRKKEKEAIINKENGKKRQMKQRKVGMNLRKMISEECEMKKF